jgi:hypothetical protein
MFTKSSRGVDVVSNVEDVHRYINQWAQEYWITIRGIDFYHKSRIQGTITHSVAEHKRLERSSVAQYPAIVLAQGKHTKLPVAIALPYMNCDDILVLLPPCKRKETSGPAESQEMATILITLEYLAKKIKEQFTLSETAEHKQWVYDYRAPTAKQIAASINELKDKEKALNDELQSFDRMLFLLDGTDTPLVDSVIQLFNRPDQGLKVTRTEKGA